MAAPERAAAVVRPARRAASEPALAQAPAVSPPSGRAVPATMAPGPLWLAVHLPHLPFEALARPQPQPGGWGVTETRGRSEVIVAADATARAAGVAPGQRLGEALALATGLRLLSRDVAAERQRLQTLAYWALQFSSQVSLLESGLILEIGGSLRLFGGPEALLARLQQGLTGLGFEADAAAAPSPSAARLFARSRPGTCITSSDELQRALMQQPVTSLDLAPRAVTLMRRLGLRTIGECRRLPRTGLARRFGPTVLQALDRLYAETPEPLPPVLPPRRFDAAQVLPAPLQGVPALLPWIERLLQQLQGLLTDLDAQVEYLELDLQHLRAAATRLRLELAAPAQDTHHWLELWRLRLEAQPWPESVTGLRLCSGPLLAAARRPRDLFDAAAGTEDRARLIERLRARLGQPAVQGLQVLADHRPEYSWRCCEPGLAARAAAAAPRPLWLLPRPEPLAGASDLPPRGIELLHGPERIEGGWWDGDDVARDYYRAREPDGSRSWLYRDRRSGRWYRQGRFA